MKIKWIGPNRIIPGHGIGETGELIEVPEAMARSFISQKLAETFREAKPKTLKTNKEE